MQSRTREAHTPGFTAERSLDARGSPYRMTATRFLSTDADIRPQMPFCMHLERRIWVASDRVAEAAAAENWSSYNYFAQYLRGLMATYIKRGC
jgi:hypothetical protein